MPADDLGGMWISYVVVSFREGRKGGGRSEVNAEIDEEAVVAVGHAQGERAAVGIDIEVEVIVAGADGEVLAEAVFGGEQHIDEFALDLVLIADAEVLHNGARLEAPRPVRGPADAEGRQRGRDVEALGAPDVRRGEAGLEAHHVGADQAGELVLLPAVEGVAVGDLVDVRAEPAVHGGVDGVGLVAEIDIAVDDAMAAEVDVVPGALHAVRARHVPVHIGAEDVDGGFPAERVAEINDVAAGAAVGREADGRVDVGHEERAQAEVATRSEASAKGASWMILFFTNEVCSRFIWCWKGVGYCGAPAGRPWKRANSVSPA